jgi:hypothetical protein
MSFAKGLERHSYSSLWTSTWQVVICLIRTGHIYLTLKTDITTLCGPAACIRLHLERQMDRRGKVRHRCFLHNSRSAKELKMFWIVTLMAFPAGIVNQLGPVAVALNALVWVSNLLVCVLPLIFVGHRYYHVCLRVVGDILPKNQATPPRRFHCCVARVASRLCPRRRPRFNIQEFTECVFCPHTGKNCAFCIHRSS